MRPRLAFSAQRDIRATCPGSQDQLVAPGRGGSVELVLGEAAPAWSPTATRGRYGDRPVIALLGPQVEGAAARGRERSVAWIGREIEGVWPLLEVVEVDGRGAWLYPHHAGVSLGPLVDGELVPMRVACEIVAELSQRVAALGPDGEGHPGPLPEDVLLDAEIGRASCRERV